MHRSSHGSRHPALVGLLLLVLVALVAAACSTDSDDSAQSASTADESPASEGSVALAPAAAPEPPADFAEEAMDEDFGGDAFDAEADRASGLTTGSAGTEATAELPDIGREIIYTASLELASTDVTTATRDAIRVVEARGGFLFSQDTQGGANGSSVLVFKIFPDQFQAALNDLGSVGTVRSQSISAEDVTAIVVDLESRINTAEASVRRLRDLLDEADDFEIIASLENQLLQRETTLEQLRGQLRSVQNQVDLATITVRVTELLNRPGVSLQTAAYGGHDGGFGCLDARPARSTDPGEPTTACYWVTNTGDTPLIDLELVDAALDASIGDMVVVEGAVTQLDPGETLVLAHEFELEETVRVRTSVTATALDADGNPLPDEVMATAATFRLEVVEPDDGIPSFGDAFSGSLNALATIAIVIALVAVAVAPFLVAGLVLFAIGWPLWRRFGPRRGDSEEAAAVPTPPAVAPVGAGVAAPVESAIPAPPPPFDASKVATGEPDPTAETDDNPDQDKSPSPTPADDADPQ